jgi:hypothetical protein
VGTDNGTSAAPAVKLIVIPIATPAQNLTLPNSTGILVFDADISHARSMEGITPGPVNVIGPVASLRRTVQPAATTNRIMTFKPAFFEVGWDPLGEATRRATKPEKAD